jgi:hypothetical protein
MTDAGSFRRFFVSNIKRLLLYGGKEGKEISKESRDIMNDIVLYIQDEADFYKAWENVFAEENVDDYEVEGGDKVKAKQSTWVERLPEVLTF